MGKTSEKLAVIGLTPRIIAFSFPFSIAWIIVFYAGFRQSLNINVAPSILLLLMVEAGLIKLLGKKYQFTVQEWTVFSTIAISGLLTGTWATGIWEHDGMIHTWLQVFQMGYYPIVSSYLLGYEFPELWVPRDPAVLDSFRFGGAVPWAAWAPTIAWWIITMIASYLSIYFLMLMFRKPWIDEERLVYPHLQPDYELLIMAKAEEETGRTPFFNFVKNKIFWIPFIIGVLLVVPEILVFTLGWPNPLTNIEGATAIDLNPYLGPIFPELTVPEWGSFAWAFSFGWCWSASPLFFFVPMDILKSILLWMLISWYIIPIILTKSGMVTAGQDYMFGEGSGWPYGVMFGFPWGLVYNGTTFGVTAWLFFHYRKNILYSLKKALAGSPREPEEPFSWRFVWVSFIVCMVVWYGLLLLSGVTPLFIVSMVMWLALYVTINRVWAETSRPLGWSGSEPRINGYMYRDSLALFGYDISKPSTDLNAVTMYFGFMRHTYLVGGGRELSGLASLKLAKMTGTNPRHVGWAYIIAVVIGVAVHIPLAIWMSHYYGWATLQSRAWAVGLFMWWGEGQPAEVGTTTSDAFGVPNYSAWVLAGAIVIFGVMWLRTRFPWFWFNPIGILIGDICGRAMMLTIVVFFLLKWAILRIGGARAYEKVGVPAMTGFWCGVTTVQIVARIIFYFAGTLEFAYA